jgi:hypothetical protein
MKNEKIVFKITINNSFVNKNDRQLIENHTFKMFENLID